VRVAKYQLSPGNHLAMFAGGGLELAERLIKSDPAFALEEQDDPEPPDLHGLSCRWEPYRSLRGLMLTLLVQPLEADELALQREMIRELATILGEVPGSASPIRRENMRFVWPPRGLRAEAIAVRGHVPYPLYWLGIWAQSWLQALAERFDLRIGAYDAPAYREELQRNSDYRKIVDTLHIVLDCTDAERAATCTSSTAPTAATRSPPSSSKPSCRRSRQQASMHAQASLFRPYRAAERPVRLGRPVKPANHVEIASPNRSTRLNVTTGWLSQGLLILHSTREQA
jgi:hypothetical protein